VRAPSINGSVCSAAFFFTVTLDRPEMARHLTFVREPRRIPVVLSLEEIARLLEAASRAEVQGRAERRLWRRIAGLRSRGAEGVGHRSERMLLRVEQGNGAQGSLRNAFPRLLELLRDWYRIARPAVLAVPGP